MISIFSLILIFLLTFPAYGKIAFVANVNGNWDLFIADDNGQNPQQLTNTTYDEKRSFMVIRSEEAGLYNQRWTLKYY
jgi:surface antigen